MIKVMLLVFLIMGKNIEQPEYDKNKKYITSCIFRVKSEPSAPSVRGFATNQVNLTKLEFFCKKHFRSSKLLS